MSIMKTTTRDETMIKRTRRPSEPGQILKNLFLDPHDITIGRFAAATGLTRKHISNVIHGRAPISADVAVKFGKVLGTGPETWVNLQRAVDVFDAEKKLKKWKPPVKLELAVDA